MKSSSASSYIEPMYRIDYQPHRLDRSSQDLSHATSDSDSFFAGTSTEGAEISVVGAAIIVGKDGLSTD